MVVTELTWQTWDALIVSGLMTGRFKGSQDGFLGCDRQGNKLGIGLLESGWTDRKFNVGLKDWNRTYR